MSMVILNLGSKPWSCPFLLPIYPLHLERSGIDLRNWFSPWSWHHQGLLIQIAGPQSQTLDMVRDEVQWFAIVVRSRWSWLMLQTPHLETTTLRCDGRGKSSPGESGWVGCPVSAESLLNFPFSLQRSMFLDKFHITSNASWACKELWESFHTSRNKGSRLKQKYPTFIFKMES